MGRKIHKVKHFRSQAAYKRFLAYIHMRTPSGKKAKRRCDTISARTPRHRKTPIVVIRKRIHRPKLT